MCGMAIGLPMALAAKRGWLVGVVAAVVFGALAVGAFRWDRLKSWSAEHPVLDSALFGPLLFLALAYITNLSTLGCVAIAAAGGGAALALGGYLRARRRAKP